MKVGENQSGLAKVATLGGEDKEGGKGVRRRRRRSYPLSGDLVGPASGRQQTPRAPRTDRQRDRETDAHMALRSDEDGKKMLEVFAADQVGKVCK